ncbi:MULTISPECIES: YjfI family protein [unclassified Gilliamella]|uniref:YjfI family protein n=1 Tax=unclassified Gilliamella TaxID=2685620 RepID=UPI00226ACC44|nr:MULTISPECIES: YjfI family protein [unclassified Gilliamella]MCX8657286.1 YjfI family protein [Gilliamella sp. B2894]MCX8665094.1 YjfI family protein [Gilliamella sp. B2887]MCX8693218.1 YjfI family protein [Gilliamella sp. B2881]MCX8697089.1 YjfI family protein [Gilliamella sp. B2828]MCX8697684.1 YjfI family protein [Gilliamella sp. B3000]
MKKTKETKNSAFYQQQYRQRLREQGLIKKEVWILPENTTKLLEIEKQFRHSLVKNNNINNNKEVNKMERNQIWSIEELFNKLMQSELVKQNHASVEIIDGIDACLHIIMHEYGDLPLFLSISNQQIVVECLLWPINMVKNKIQFNEEILCTRKLFPLSTIAIEKAGDGSVNYIMYGALSSSSLLSNIIYELETLSDNVIKATEAYEHHITLN